MAVLDSVITFEGTEAGFFLKDVTENPTIADLGFEIITEPTDTFLYLNTEMDKLTKADTGCGLTDSTDGASIYRKEMIPKRLKAFKQQCYTDFDNTIFAAARKQNVDISDLTSGQLRQLLSDLFMPVVTRDALRILLLGDTGLSDADYNQLTGVYAKLAAGASVADGSGVLIPDAGAISDSDITTANIQATLEAVFAAQHRKLRQVPLNQKRFFVTYSVWNAYAEFILSKNGSLESSMTKLQNGIQTLAYKGIPLVSLDIVDEYLSSDFTTGSPATVTNPHRIILTKPDNHVLQLPTNRNYNQVKFWYDENTELNKMKAVYSMIYEYKYPELIVIAGF